MALSGIDEYSLTRDQIIRASFETIGVAIANEPLEAADIGVAQVALNVLTMSWKSLGLQLWKRGRLSLTNATTPALVASTYKYELGGTTGSFLLKPMRILEVSRVDSSGNETSLNKLTLQEYEALPNKTTTGTPVSYYVEPKRLVSDLYLWLSPDATFVANETIDIVYTAPMETMDVGNEDVDFPNEWYRALILNLALDLAPKYGLDKYETEALRTQARDALELARDFDTEDGSVFFQPNYNGARG